MHGHDIPPDDPLNHDGELLMRRRFPSNYHWDAGNLPAMMRASLSASLARFIEAHPSSSSPPPGGTAIAIAAFGGGNIPPSVRPCRR